MFDSSILNAAIRAVQGASDVNDVLYALHHDHMAQVVALAPDAHRVIRSIAALVGRLPALVDATTIADPAFHDAMVRLIGTPEGRHAITALATVAPAGWGAVHADALVASVQKMLYDSKSAAALIGPCDSSAVLLFHSRHTVLRFHSQHIAFAIRRWGQATPETPTAWFDSLSADKRDRLLSTLRIDPHAVARCLPWLPPDRMNQSRIEDAIGWALHAFAEASPTARALHADILRRLVAQTNQSHLGELTRLACAMESKEVWDRVRALVQADPFAADRVVIAAPWEEIAETVRSDILNMADRYDICAAIAAARGQKKRRTHHNLFRRRFLRGA